MRAWSRASELAGATPPERNRVADLLRAVSILVVVLGHWLMAAPYVDGAGAHAEHVLSFAPWTHRLTWALQVMPVFFFVGGYSNAISWRSSLARGRPYGEWLRGRVERLLAPVLPVVLLWVALAEVGRALGVPQGMLLVATVSALIPTWFLAVYLVVIPLVPLAHAAWRRFGMASVWAPVLAAAALDGLHFGLGVQEPSWANYLFVWGAVHQLGFAWLDGRFASRLRAAAWAAGGLALLFALTEHGPWPRSLVGVPGEEVSNTTPPRAPLLALAAFQFGLSMLFEPLLRRWLERRAAWTATVLLNGLIMTIFLWHSTVMMLLFGLSLWLADAAGLRALPGSSAWWLLKLPWVLLFAAVLLALAGPLSRFERPPASGARPRGAWRLIGGSLLACAGLAWLTLGGLGGDAALIQRVGLGLLPWAGAELAGLGPLARLARAQA